MFGDKPFYGVKNSKLDYKGRFVMPAFTGAEVSDEIGISVFDSSQLRLYNLQKITTEIEKLKHSCLTESDEIMIAKIKGQIEKILNSIKATSSIDGQHRILLPKSIINAGSYGQYVTIQGVYDYVRVFNSEESYELYISNSLTR